MASEDYRRASYETWRAMAAGWDRERSFMFEASRPVSDWLIAALEPRPGQTILELAAGTGDTGFLAARVLGPEGRLISTDLVPEMVSAARAESERLGLGNVEHRVMDAEQIELPDDSVDGALCRWGYMLMADRERALAETRRVLRQGGRLVLAVWADAERNPWASLPGRELLAQTGAPPPDPSAPGMFALADREQLRSLLLDAGFGEPRIDEVEAAWRFPDGDTYWRFLSELAGALALAIGAMPEDERARLRERTLEAVAAYRDGDGLRFPGVALCAATT